MCLVALAPAVRLRPRLWLPKSWFHHLQIHSSSRRWMRFKLRTGEAFEVEALPFGLSCSPYWAHRLAKPILAWVRNTLQDVTVVWYVGDIATLGKTQQDVERAAAAVGLRPRLGLPWYMRVGVLRNVCLKV